MTLDAIWVKRGLKTSQIFVLPLQHIYIMDKVVKAIVWSGGIIGCGYVLMKTTVPTEQDMINVSSLENELAWGRLDN